MRGEHRTANRRFVTAEETAELLRVALNTVYRWCRSGRLRARKFGRQWRIDGSALEELGYPGPKSKPVNLVEHILPHLHRDGEHLFALSADEASALRLQAAFLEAALRQPDAAVYLGLWDESPAEATRRLRASLAPETEMAKRLRFLPLGKWYRRSGLAAVLNGLQDAATRGREAGERVWATSFPQRFFGASIERLMEYELASREALRGQPMIAFCTYEHTSNRQQLLRAAFDLMSCHSGAVYFDGWHPPYLLRRIV
jgi:excisionase family DNA binding protein